MWEKEMHRKGRAVARRRLVARADASILPSGSAATPTAVLPAIPAPTQKPGPLAIAAMAINGTMLAAEGDAATSTFESLLLASDHSTALPTSTGSTNSSSSTTAAPTGAADTAQARQTANAKSSTRQSLLIGFGVLIALLMLIVVIFIVYRMRKGYTFGEIVCPPRRRRKSSKSMKSHGAAPTARQWSPARPKRNSTRLDMSDANQINLQSTNLPPPPRPPFLRPDTASSERTLVSAAQFPGRLIEEPRSPPADAERTFSTASTKRPQTPPRPALPSSYRPPTPPKDDRPPRTIHTSTSNATAVTVTALNDGQVSPLSDTLPANPFPAPGSRSSTYSTEESNSPIPTYLQNLAATGSSPPAASRFSWTTSHGGKTPVDQRFSADTTASSVPRYRTVESWVGLQTNRLNSGQMAEHLAREMGVGERPRSAAAVSPIIDHNANYLVRMASLMRSPSAPRRIASPIPEQDSTVGAQEDEELSPPGRIPAVRKDSTGADSISAPLPLLLPNRQLDRAMEMQIEQQQQQQQTVQVQVQQPRRSLYEPATILAPFPTPTVEPSSLPQTQTPSPIVQRTPSSSRWARRARRETSGSDATVFRAHPGTRISIPRGSRVPSEILDESIAIV